MNEPKLTREDVLRIVGELDFFGGEDCWLTSGAALVLYGVKKATRDVDIICTRRRADALEACGVPLRRDGLDGTRIFAVNEAVEVLEDWETEQVVPVEGLRAASLKSIRKQKEKLGREKDLADIALIDQFLRQGACHHIRLETPRLILRDYIPADEEDYYLLKSDEGAMARYQSDIMLHSREEARQEFADILADASSPDRTFYFLRVEDKDTGRQLGSVGYTVTDRTPVGKLVGAGYFYLPEFWGQGFGTEAFRRVLSFAFEENGVYRVSTGCLKENHGSERIMQKCGLIKEAEHVNWQWHEGQMKTRLEYRLLREEYDTMAKAEGSSGSF